MKDHRTQARELVSLAVDLKTPAGEARKAAIDACRLIHRHNLLSMAPPLSDHDVPMPPNVAPDLGPILERDRELGSLLDSELLPSTDAVLGTGPDNTCLACGATRPTSPTAAKAMSPKRK